MARTAVARSAMRVDPVAPNASAAPERKMAEANEPRTKYLKAASPGARGEVRGLDGEEPAGGHQHQPADGEQDGREDAQQIGRLERHRLGSSGEGAAAGGAGWVGSGAAGPALRARGRTLRWKW